MVSVAEYKKRIASASSLKKIFRAQELISTSGIRMAKQKSESSKPYSQYIEQAIELSLANLDLVENKIDSPLINPHPSNKAGILVVTSDKGMAGPFNSGILKQVELLIKKLDESNIAHDLFVVGRKGVSYYNFHNIKMKYSWVDHSSKPDFKFAQEIGEKIIQSFHINDSDSENIAASADLDYSNYDHISYENIPYSEFYVVYSDFVNMVVQNPTIIRLLPLQYDFEHKTQQGYNSIYTFEPSIQEMLSDLLERYLYNRIYHILLESVASETASRQRAMHTANENVDELLTELTRKKNQVRQANITNELNEIAGVTLMLNKEEKDD